MAVIFEVDRLKKEAQALRDILLKYKDQEPDADLCLQALDPIIQQVLDGKITPSSQLFHLQVIDLWLTPIF